MIEEIVSEADKEFKKVFGGTIDEVHERRRTASSRSTVSVSTDIQADDAD